MEGSLYDLMKTRLTVPKNLGYNYSDKILIRNTDPNLYANPTIRGFATRLEAILQSWFRSVKLLRTATNPAVNKDTNYIN